MVTVWCCHGASEALSCQRNDSDVMVTRIAAVAALLSRCQHRVQSLQSMLSQLTRMPHCDGPQPPPNPSALSPLCFTQPPVPATQAGCTGVLFRHNTETIKNQGFDASYALDHSDDSENYSDDSVDSDDLDDWGHWGGVACMILITQMPALVLSLALSSSSLSTAR